MTSVIDIFTEIALTRKQAIMKPGVNQQQALNDLRADLIYQLATQGLTEVGSPAGYSRPEAPKPLPRLGRLKTKLSRRTLRLADYLPTLPQFPAGFDWTSKVTQPWGMMANDSIGDCTCAAAGHLIMSWLADNGIQVAPAVSQIIAAYSAITGYNPTTGANDNGAGEVDVLDYWRTPGIAGHKIGAYVYIDPTNIDHIKFAIWAFGGVYLGAALPSNFQGAAAWTRPANISEPGAQPGSWGGHAIPGLAYDAQGLTVITWGAPLKADWGLFSADYPVFEEAYAILSPDFINGTKPAPSGFDMASLVADLKAVTSN